MRNQSTISDTLIKQPHHLWELSHQPLIYRLFQFKKPLSLLQDGVQLSMAVRSAYKLAAYSNSVYTVRQRAE